MKGTTGDGSRVIVTAGEVRHARTYEAVSLVVVSGITVSADSAGNIAATGGAMRVLDPWDIDAAGSLEPIEYFYSLR